MRCIMVLSVQKPGKRILGELNKTSTVLRDVLRPECELIRVNDENWLMRLKLI